MTITAPDIRMRQSQRLTDNPDGGGRMVATEIVDGAINNLFPDIGDEERTTGRATLRKMFVHVDTPTTDVLKDAIAFIIDPPDDPQVSMSMFATGSYSDERAAAQNRVESYVTRGVESRFVLMGDHYVGGRALTFYCMKDAPSPDVNDSLCLSTEASGYDPNIQYVRVERIEARTTQTFYDGQGAFERDVLVVSITTPLVYDFHGQEPVRLTATKPPTRVRVTNVVDAASYYSIRKLSDAVDAGALVLDIGSPYVPLVPSTQAETAVVDVRAGLGAVSIVRAGADDVLSISTSGTFTAGVRVQRFLGNPILPGSAEVVIGATTLVDAGDGTLAAVTASAWSGTVDYVAGSMSIVNNAGAGLQAFSVTAAPAGVISTQGYTQGVDISAGNQQYNYVLQMVPLPSPGTVTVDYMALGKWVRLTDNGAGQLSGNAGEGSGTINYSTGSLVATLGALPDVDSRLIVSYGTGVTTERRDGDVEIAPPYLNYLLPDEGILPGTFSAQWLESTITKTVTDDGAGNLKIGATVVGRIVYATGEVGFRPTAMPDGGTQIINTYQWGMSGSGNFTPTPDSNGFVSMLVPDAPLRPGSVRFEWTVAAVPGDNILGATLVPLKLVAVDDGAGNLVAVSAGGASLSGTLGTINYTTGAAVLKAGKVVVDEMSFPHYRTDSSFRLRVDYFVRAAVTTTFTAGTPVIGSWQAASAADTLVEDLALALPAVVLQLTPGIVDAIVPGSVRFTFRGRTYVDRSGSLYYGIDPTTGAGTYAGTIDYASGEARIAQWVTGGANTVSIDALLTRIAEVGTDEIAFRTPGAPLRPGSFTVRATALDGTLLTASADINGTITGSGIAGTVDWSTGAATIRFGGMVTAAGNEGEPWYRAGDVVAGQVWRPLLTIADSVYFGTVVYRSIPLSSVVVGLDPVRLPSDGRVVAYKPGQTVVVHHTDEEVLTPTAGQLVTLPRNTLSIIEVRDDDGTPIDSAWYTLDLDAGTVQWSNPLNLGAYAMPVRIRHTIADRRLVSDVQITGQLGINTGLSRAFPADAYVSTALRLGEANGSLDLQARVQGLFDQGTWTGVWSDQRIGDQADATYNDVDYPLAVDNGNCITERWVIEFTSATAFHLIGETVGQIATGNITADLAPLNPRTGEPYFTLDKDGWGGGWSAGNAVRFNTIGALAPIWLVRTTLAGAATSTTDSFRLQVVGNITGGGA